MNITDSIIPPNSELAHRLLQWSESVDTSTWQIANVTNELIDELDGVKMEDGTPITLGDIYKAVSSRCKGRKPNTVRRWAECARDYPVDIQEQYAQLLSFEHFKVSRRLFNEGLTPTIDYALAWCVSGDDEKVTAGRFHTVGEMLNHFAPELRDDTAVAYWKGVKEKLYDKIIVIDNDITRKRALGAWKEMTAALEGASYDVISSTFTDNSKALEVNDASLY